MEKFHIFVEGKADKKFLLDYIESEFNVSLGATFNSEGGIKKLDSITDTGGWTKLSSDEGQTFHKTMKENTDNGITNLVIFDADTKAEGGGFADRKAELEKLKTEKGIDFELFLFPYNKGDGALEDLLEQIINPINKPVFTCWKNFEKCLRAKKSCTKNPLSTPAKKSKIYAYMEALHGNSKSEKDKIKDANRNFKNPAHWDLKATALEPLKKFLHKNLDKHLCITTPPLTTDNY